MGKIDELIKQLCPKGVENIRLGDYCNILNGFAFKSKQYVPEGVRVIRISDVQDGYISSSDKKFYPKTFLEETDKYNLYNGDLVMSLTGNCGRVAFIKHCMLPAALNQRVACLRSKKGLDIKYLFYILFNKEFQKAAMQSANGAGQKNLSTTWLSSYTLPLPPLAVQKKIVEILDTFTGMISNLQKELEQRQKQFEYYCENLVGSAKGEVKTLGEIGRMERGTGLQKSDFRDTGVPCIHYGQIHTYYNTVATETKSFCSEELAKKLRKAKPGDLLIATTSEDVEACCKARLHIVAIPSNSAIIKIQSILRIFSKQKRFQNRSVCVLQEQKSCEYLGLLWKSLSLVSLLSINSKRLLISSTPLRLLSLTSSRRLSCARSNTSTIERNFSHLNNS